MPSIRDEAKKLVKARKDYDEAREKSRAAMIDSMTQYELVIQRMKREKIEEVKVDGVTITLREATGIRFLDIVDDEAEPEHNRPEFGGIKGAHENLGQ